MESLIINVAANRDVVATLERRVPVGLLLVADEVLDA